MTNSANTIAISDEYGLQQYLSKINKIPSLTKEEEFLLAKNYLENNNLDAAHKLVVSHLKLVAKIAMQYKRYGLPVRDLISEGNIGLMQGVKKYDPDLGFRLSTYAMCWIKAAIQEYVLKSWSLVKIGTTSAQKKLFFSLAKVKKKLVNVNTNSITDAEYNDMAKQLGVNINDVKLMDVRLSKKDISLNQSANSNDDEFTEEMIDNVPDVNTTQELLVINRQEANNKRNILKQAIVSVLNDREQKILYARKLSNPIVSLKDLAMQYNISTERVRQISDAAFNKVKKFMLNYFQENRLY
ncbi:MAG: RNA polymerase factor sigma-32 [Rickettsiaceae bacterium]